MFCGRLTSLRLVWTGEVARPYLGTAFEPDSSKSGDALCRDPEIGTSSDQDFFQPTHILDCAESFPLAIDSKTAQIEDRICNKLTRSTESDVTATVASD